MYWIPTTIKKKWLELIISGEKTIEYKVDSAHWEPRMAKAMSELAFGREVGASFLCGQESVKYKVTKVERIFLPKIRGKPGFDLDGKEVWRYYEVHLGERIE